MSFIPEILICISMSVGSTPACDTSTHVSRPQTLEQCEYIVNGGIGEFRAGRLKSLHVKQMVEEHGFDPKTVTYEGHCALETPVS